MPHAIIALCLLIFWTASLWSDPSVTSPTRVIGSDMGCGTVAGKIPKTDASGIAQCSDDAGAGTGAPTASTYLLKTPDGSLPNAQAMSSLGTGITINTTTTGAQSIYGGAPCTNAFIEDLDAIGTPNCQQVTNAHIANATIAAAKLAFTPIASGDAAGGSLSGTYPNPSIADNAVALGTKTTGNYVGQLTAGTDIGLTNCTPGEGPNCTINSLGAPASPPYWTGAADPTLSAERNLGALATGLVLNTAGTPSAYGGTGPVANQCLVSLDGAGVGTFSQITPEFLSFDPFTQLEADAHTTATTSVHGIPDTALLVRRDGSVLQDKVVINDTDATPIANKQLQNKDGRVQCAGTAAGAEERCIANTSLELINSAALASGAVTQPKMVLGTGAGDANTLTIHDLINGAPNINDCVQWSGSNWVPAACTGGGGGGSTTIPSVALVATTPLTLSGEQTIDGVLTAGSRVLTTAQSDATTNRVYVTGAGAWTVATDFDAGAEFVLNMLVRVQAGTLNANTYWQLQNTSAIILGTTNISWALAAAGPRTELTSRMSVPGATVAGGYLGASTSGRLPWASFGDYAAHSALSAPGTITPTQPTMGIEGTGAAVNLTSDPNIAAGSYHGQRLTLKGTHATNTVIIEDESVDAASGVYLCGRTGSVTLGLGLNSLDLEWNSTLSKWQEMGCKDLQRAANLGNTIDKPGIQLSLRDGTSGWDFKVTAGKAILECIASGAACDNEWTVPTGKIGSFFSNTTEIARLTQTTNAWDFMAGHLHLRGGTGAPTGTDCDAAGEARRVWIQTDAAPGSMVWTCRGAAGWAQSGVTGVVKSFYIDAAAFETDQTVCTDPVRGTVNGAPKQTITCTDPGSNTAALYTSFIMPTSWNPLTGIDVTTDWFSASNLSTQHVDTDWNGFCVRDNDAVPAHNTTGVQTAVTTFGNQTNDEQMVTTSPITLNGSCAAGARVYLQGRMLSATTATMTLVRFLGMKVRYGINAISD